MNMNKKLLTAVLGAAVVGFGSYSVSIKAATDTGNASADIVTAITINQTTPMRFGDIATTGAGTVVLSTGNSVAGDANNSPSGGTVSSAVFGLTGDNVGYVITMPALITVTEPGTDTMTIDTFTYLAEDTATDGTGTISGNVGTMTIGGTLNIGAGQTAGPYTGTYTITALYE